MYEIRDSLILSPSDSHRLDRVDTHLSPPPVSDNRDVQLKHIAIMGNFPPRQCGLATFTRDIHACLHEALPEAQIDVIAMNDKGLEYDYPEVVTHQIAQEDGDAYHRLAEDLNRRGVQAVFVQHEFGIYGGDAGAHLIKTLERLDAPVITTLHTILETPNDTQNRVMRDLIRLSSRLIVMSRKGADILQHVYQVPATQIHIIPHGAPSRPLSNTAPFKAALGFGERMILTTFGLLSPNKGIETIIEALPEIVKTTPEALYLVVGATHPHLVAHEGEVYREGLLSRARELGVENNIRFINRFVDDAYLIDILQATDVYVTPYLTETQITSGTLSYALALGCPVVSTPYWHAAEALSGGVGVLCGFGDSRAFATAISDLLQHPEDRQALSQKAYDNALPSRWPSVAQALADTAIKDIRDKKALPPRSQTPLSTSSHSPMPPSMPRSSAPKNRLYLTRAPSWGAIERMSDDCGIFQHGKYRLPDRSHGYCTDDNVRALSLVARQSLWVSENRNRDALAYRYAAFVNHAWCPETGRFRNFMSYSRAWLDEGGSDDCCARALEALCDVIRSDLPEDLRLWARELAQRVATHAGDWASHRARAIVIRVLSDLNADLGDRKATEALIGTCAQSLYAGFQHHARDGHTWMEPQLSYDNARLSAGLLIAGNRYQNSGMWQAGMDSLRWLMDIQKGQPGGHFRPVPTTHFDKDTGTNPIYDQQPLEVQASIEACLIAFRLSHDRFWKHEAHRAFGWFFGDNDQGLPLVTADGGCFDGLTPEGCNHNQGAESLLAYHLSWTALMDEA